MNEVSRGKHSSKKAYIYTHWFAFLMTDLPHHKVSSKSKLTTSTVSTSTGSPEGDAPADEEDDCCCWFDSIVAC